jgi:hypothetical protein
LAFDIPVIPVFSVVKILTTERAENAVNLFPMETTMKSTIVLVTILSAVAVAFSQPPAPKAISSFEQQLVNQQKEFLNAVQSKKTSSVDHSVADDFQGIGLNGDFYDRGEIVESAQEGAPEGTRAYDFHVVKLSNDSAVVAYNLIVPGEHPRYRHMSDTWARIDGRWKLKFRQITPNLWSANDLD